MDQRELSDKQRVWLSHVEACVNTGVSMKEYAERHGLNLQSFYFWKGRLKKLGVVDEQSGRASAIPVRVEPLVLGRTFIQLSNGVNIEVPGDFDAAMMAELLKLAVRF